MSSIQRGYRRMLAGVIGGLSALFAYFATITFHRIAAQRYSDFDVFFSAARALRLHQDPYLPGHRDYLYPPLIAFLYVPLTLMSEQKAAVIVLAAGILFLVLALWILATQWLCRLQVHDDSLARWVIALLAVLLIYDKVKDELQMLQTNSLMLLMLVLALYWLDRKPALAGIALGFACNIKYLPLILLPWLAVRRRGTVAFFFLISAVGFALLPALYSGWSENLRNLSVAFGGLARMVGIETNSAPTGDVWSLTASLSLSLTSAMARLTHQFRADSLLFSILLVLVAGTLTMVWSLYRRNHLPFLRWPRAQEQCTQPFCALIAVEYSSLLALALVFSPQTNPPHLVLLLPATTLIAALLLVMDESRSRKPLVLASAVLVLGLTFPWGGTLTRLASSVGPWFTYGGQGWCMLAATALLIAAGLKRAAALAPNATASFERQPSQERLEVAACR